MLNSTLYFFYFDFLILMFTRIIAETLGMGLFLFTYNNCLICVFASFGRLFLQTHTISIDFRKIIQFRSCFFFVLSLFLLLLKL